MNVLVVGSGVYVCGRGGSGFGTILPALFPLVADGRIKRLAIAVTGQRSAGPLSDKIAGLNAMLGLEIKATIVNLEKSSLTSIIESEGIDMAYVCTPDHTHFEITRTLLAHKVHVQVVKPLAPSSRECAELAKLQEASGVLGCVEYHKRFDRSNRQLKNVLETGKIGDPLYFIVEYSQRKVVPLKHFQSWAAQSNPFQYLGVHYADVIAWGLGHRAKALRVSAHGSKNFLAGHGVDTLDSVSTAVEYELAGKKFTAHFFINWIDPDQTSSMSDQRIKVIGTKGRMECDQKDRGVTLVTDEEGGEVINPDFCRAYASSGADGKSRWRYEGYGIDSVAGFVSEVRAYAGGELDYAEWKSNRATFAQSVDMAHLLEAVEASLAHQGAWEKVGE